MLFDFLYYSTHWTNVNSAMDCHPPSNLTHISTINKSLMVSHVLVKPPNW